jgi:hypothetical protein
MALTKDFIVKNGLVVLGQGSAQSTSTNTGALVVQGGAGILGNVYIGSTTSSVSTNTGAIQIQGGVGVGGNIYAGGGIFSGGLQVLTSATLGTYGVSAIQAGTDTAVSTATGVVTIWNTATLQSVTGRGATTNNAIQITNITAATSSTGGALSVTGGVGIGGSLYVGGGLYTGGTQILPMSIQEFVASAGQTLFTVAGGYSTGTVIVTANGVELGNTDIVATNGTTVTLNTPRALNDIVRIKAGITSASINNNNVTKAFSIAMSVALG